MAEEDLVILVIVILAIGGFALAIAALLESLGIPPDITAQIGAVLFFGIFLAGIYKLLS